jgi:hypothetical protein
MSAAFGAFSPVSGGDSIPERVPRRRDVGEDSMPVTGNAERFGSIDV